MSSRDQDRGLAAFRAMRVLVTDGDSRAALAIVRSLGRRGHHVIVGERRTPALAQRSRYCKARMTYADPFTRERAFISGLVSEVERQRIDVLLPVSDVTTALVASNRTMFEPRCHVPIADGAALGRAADKVEIMRLAESLGVPIPKTVYLDDVSQVGQAVKQLSFPIVVKPRRSRVRTGDGWRACTVAYAWSAEDLDSKVRDWPEGAYPLILQERITGPGIGVFLCVHQGTTVAAFSHRRLREKPPSGGVSVLSESIETRPDLRRHSERLLHELGWTGVAMAEFKLDLRDAVPKLMEINGRFWGSLQLAIDAGVDFPAILIDTLTGNPPRSMPSYQVGIRSRWFWGDVDSLLTTLFGRSQAGTPTASAKLRSAVGFLKLWEKGLRYDNPKLSDPGPWYHESVHWFRDLLAARFASGQLDGRAHDA